MHELCSVASVAAGRFLWGIIGVPLQFRIKDATSPESGPGLSQRLSSSIRDEPCEHFHLVHRSHPTCPGTARVGDGVDTPCRFRRSRWRCSSSGPPCVIAGGESHRTQVPG